MFELILHLVLFPAFFLVALYARNLPATGKVSRGSMLQRVQTRLLSYAFLISASPYLSEILISAAVSLLFLILRRAGLRAPGPRLARSLHC